ncbi:hypothetical protein [Butyrivibrio proteoclasticus]|uniref:hypothetical protein n=1 Tax=Butyrivibrio proteoclasticus TaxID=43305 RepID=UPI000684AEF9|nr:hypothetical protein [Butyrivibrio proteoclasticus]
MSKGSGIGKFVLFCAAVGAAAAGAYYYLTKRDAEIADSFDDDFDDFDDFEDDEFESSADVKFGSRKYVDIKTGEDNEAPAKESEPKPASSEEFFNDEDK